MAWTTRIVFIDKDTGEVLEKNHLPKINYEIKGKQTIYHKIHETHTERIIIYLCAPRAQQQIQF